MPVTDAFLVTRNGMNIGPFTLEQCEEMVRRGQLFPSDLIWQQGMTYWRPLGEILAIRRPIQYQPTNLAAKNVSVAPEKEESVAELLGQMGCGCLLWIGLLILAVGGGLVFPLLLILLPIAFIGGLIDMVKKLIKLSQRRK